MKSANRPFWRLTSHFFQRFFDADLTGSEDGTRSGIGGLLAVLAVPGAAMSLVLFGKYSSLMRWFQRDFHFDRVAASVPDKYTFLAFSMMITGLVTILKWDSLFPDRRDYANLTPLPLSSIAIFFGKLFALMAFLFVFVFDLNAVSSVLFPLIVLEDTGTFRELLRFLYAHALSVGAASLFTFCALLGGVGFLMTVLPYKLFRRVTRYVQFVCAAALLMSFFSVPAVLPELEKLRQGTESGLIWMPPVWFLAWYCDLQGEWHRGFAPLSDAAAHALLWATAAAAFFYAASYRTFFLRTAEMPEVAGSTGKVLMLLFGLGDLGYLRTEAERVCFRFTLRTLFRSDRHCAMLAGGLGLGAALAVQSAIGPPGVGHPTAAQLSSLLTILFFLVTGVRFSFGIPAELRSNWVFQTALVDDKLNATAVARKVMWALAVPILLGGFAVHTVSWGIEIASVHVGYSAVVSTFLMELALLGYTALPFTCADLPGRANMVLAIALYAAAYLIFAHGLAGLEAWMLVHPLRWIVFAFFGSIAAFGLHQLQDNETRVRYESESEGVLLLRLSE